MISLRWLNDETDTVKGDLLLSRISDKITADIKHALNWTELRSNTNDLSEHYTFRSGLTLIDDDVHN